MQGIDISSYQSGIDLSSVPCDFVIVKATQGTYYTNPDCCRAYEQARALGKPRGTYHYISGGDAVAEADYYIDSIANWVGSGILCLDWEESNNSAWGDTEYLAQVVQRVIERTGIPPLIYASAAVFPWDVAAQYNCGTWVAQYADMNPTGYQDNPWNEDDYACVIRQYTSTGSLPSWDGNLDLNKSYIDAETWAKYAKPSGNTVTPQPSAPSESAPQGSTLDLVVNTMQGAYGEGNSRAKALGSRYNEVQDFINHIYSADAATLASEVWDGMYGDGDTRRMALGGRYEEVMNVVNQSEAITYIVQSGDTLSSIADRYGTTYQAIADKNGISNPNVIYPGQVLYI